MNADDVRARLEELPLAAAIAFSAGSAVLLVAAIVVQVGARRLRRELHLAESQLVDRRTGLLPRSALRIRLGAEIAWAITSSTPIAVAVLRIRGPRFRDAAAVLRHAMREEESAFVLRRREVVVELWGTTAEAVDLATERLGLELARAGHPVVDAGVACALRDGADVDTLVAAARHDLRPVDELASGRGGAGPLEAAARILAGIVGFGLLALAAWRLLPAAIEPALAAGGRRSDEQWGYALVALVGFPLAAVLLHATCWNAASGYAPRSRPLGRADGRSLGVLGASLLLPLGWALFAPLEPAELADAFPAVLAVAVLVLLVLAHARQLVHLPATFQLGLALLGAALAWGFVHVESMPLVADAGRILAAAALGTLLARGMRRPSWFVVALVAAAAADAAIVLADGARETLEWLLGSERAADLLPLLTLPGPAIAGGATFLAPVAGLAVVSMVLAWTHDWRYDMRVVIAVVLAAWWATIVAAELADMTLPMLPAIAAGVLAVVAWRALLLRARGAAWRWLRENPGPVA